ncbi:MAG: hypothetical protein FWB90_09815 [Fibromonadales bacterium]|nr:hypothetical protein [Fibromonadales bacterium]
MRKEYDFAKMQGKPNPYAKLLKNDAISKKIPEMSRISREKMSFAVV